MVITLIKILALAWFISTFKPLHQFIDFIKSLIKNSLVYIITDTLHEMISCQKCCSFWIGLIFTQSIWFAIAAAFTAYVYNWKISPWIETIKMPIPNWYQKQKIDYGSKED